MDPKNKPTLPGGNVKGAGISPTKATNIVRPGRRFAGKGSRATAPRPMLQHVHGVFHRSTQKRIQANSAGRFEPPTPPAPPESPPAPKLAP